MKQSIRRIANILLIVGVLGLSYSFLSTLSFQCGFDSRGCMATLFGVMEPAQYESSLTVTQTTESMLLEGISLLAVLQLMSAYLLLIAVVVLVVLECIELHYLRQFTQGKHAFRLR